MFDELAVMVPRRQLAPLRRKLLRWYRANRRDFPWRRGRDPYRIWLAEIMLQQTRIAAALPYYERFLERFANVRELAEARESEVLKYWAGLGYYRRARNLHRAARQIVREHAAQFPSDANSALALPGIGRYTAAAILSIAYDAPLAALDGNVARVLVRLCAVRGDLRAPKMWRKLAAAAQTLLPSRAPGDWNQAMMELGETFCTPRSPNCAACPIARHCKARALGIADKLPVARQKRALAKVHIAAAVLVDSRGHTLLTRIPGAHDSVLFSRLWQFPAVAITSNGDSGHGSTSDSANRPTKRTANELVEHLRTSLGILNQPLTPLPVASHAVTFRKITLAPFLARVARLPKRPGCRTLPLRKLRRLPISSATQKIARAAIDALGQ